MSQYEAPALLAEYLLFHYGEQEEILPYPFGPHNALFFPVRCITELGGELTSKPDSRALDLGCAVGRSTFELSKHYGEVIGIDYSSSFITAANTIKDDGQIPYSRKDHGDHYTELHAKRPPDSRPQNIHFETGDACHLREDLGSFDLLLAANLLCRLPDPMLLIKRLPTLVNTGGTLLITTPYTWLEEFTPKNNWIGATPKTGSSTDGLKNLLSDNFDLIHTQDMPFLIREHERKYQWSVAQGTRWKRK